MNLSNENYQENVKNLENILVKVHASHGTGKKILGLIFNSDKTAERLLQSGFYSVTVEIDLKEENKIANDLDTIDFGKLLGSKKFDSIYIGNILHYAKDPSKILNQLYLHLNENGILIGYFHNISHASTRVCLLDGYLDYRKIGLNEKALHHYNLDNFLLLLDSANYSLSNLYKIKDEIDIKRTDLFHYKFPPDLVDSILADPESSTVFYVFEAIPGVKVDKFTRKWASQFSKNIVTEKLDSLIELYKKLIDEKSSIIDYYQKVIKDKQIDVQKIEKQSVDLHSSDSKESHLLQVIEQKNILAKGLTESIEQKDSYIRNLIKSIGEKDEYIKDLIKSIGEKDVSIERIKVSNDEVVKQLKELQIILQARSEELVKIHNSFTWKFFRKLDKIHQR